MIEEGIKEPTVEKGDKRMTATPLMMVMLVILSQKKMTAMRKKMRNQPVTRR